jgi:hypothetical protein
MVLKLQALLRKFQTTLMKEEQLSLKFNEDASSISQLNFQNSQGMQ